MDFSIVKIAKKVKPYLKRHTSRIFRSILLEPFGFDWLSKPYPGHKKLISHINYKRGFFVEVGANDGYFQDPTYYYERILDWKGILIEPLLLYKKCKKNRPKSLVLNFACVPSDYEKDSVVLIDSNAMSFVKNGIPNEQEWIEEWERISDRQHREISVPAKTLTKILDDYFSTRALREIDLLSIDVEGFELEVLKGLDFEKYNPKYILLESHSNVLLEKIKTKLFPTHPTMFSITEIDFLFSKKDNT